MPIVGQRYHFAMVFPVPISLTRYTYFETPIMHSIFSSFSEIHNNNLSCLLFECCLNEVKRFKNVYCALSTNSFFVGKTWTKFSLNKSTVIKMIFAFYLKRNNEEKWNSPAVAIVDAVCFGDLLTFKTQNVQKLPFLNKLHFKTSLTGPQSFEKMSENFL